MNRNRTSNGHNGHHRDSETTGSPIAAQPPAERVALLQQIKAEAAALRKRAERLPLLTAEQRLHSGGKFKEHDDAVADGVILAMETAPAAFVIKKNGVTTIPDSTGARADLACRALAMSISEDLDVIAQRSSDSVLFFGGRAKEVTGPAYPLAVQIAARNEDIAQHMTPAVEVNARPARTRKKRQRPASGKAKAHQTE